jgi:hypothetical protein
VTSVKRKHVDKPKPADDRKKVRLSADLSAQIAQIAIENQSVRPDGRIEGKTQTEIVENAIRLYLDTSRKKSSKNFGEDRTIGEVVNKKTETIQRPMLISRRDVHQLLDGVLDLSATSDSVRCIAQYLSSLGAALQHVPQEAGKIVESNKRQDKFERAEHSPEEKHAGLAGKLKKRRGDTESYTRNEGIA